MRWIRGIDNSKWNMDKNQKFELYEYDSKVMPFLLFNMAVRNIECKVYHSDVLKQEVFHTYKIARGKNSGDLRKYENEENINIKSTV